jgi:hypothetical protein
LASPIKEGVKAGIKKNDSGILVLKKKDISFLMQSNSKISGDDTNDEGAGIVIDDSSANQVNLSSSR